MTGYVYVLKSELGHIKFGFTKTPERRFSGLRSANSTAFEVLHVVAGSLAQERFIHQTLKPHKLRGEWYHDTEEVRAFIELVARNELPLADDYQSDGRELSQDMKDCKRAALAIMACGAVFGLAGHEDIAKKFGIEVRPLFKFLYRPTEPMVGEYLMLMQGCVHASQEAKKHLEGIADFAAAILADHDTGIQRANEAGLRLAALEAELSA